VTVVCGETGVEEARLANEEFRFDIGDDDGTVPPAALADLDNDNGLEIIAGGGERGSDYGGPAHDPWAWITELYVFEKSGSSLSPTTLRDSIPIPGRKVPSLVADGEPVVGDIDPDSLLEIIVPVGSGYLACYEWDQAKGDARPERGWPQLFHDAPRTPTIADLDGSGNLEMVVTDAAGWVHVFELPGEASGANLPWPEYGHDVRNTFNATTTQSGRGVAPPGESAPVALDASELRLRLGPNPFNPYLRLFFGLNERTRIRADILDVGGRRVKRLLDQELAPGKHQIMWNGRTDSGKPVSSGVYFLRFGGPAGVEVRKILVVK
jgi:hypothetical protein